MLVLCYQIAVYLVLLLSHLARNFGAAPAVPCGSKTTCNFTLSESATKLTALQCKRIPTIVRSKCKLAKMPVALPTITETAHAPRLNLTNAKPKNAKPKNAKPNGDVAAGLHLYVCHLQVHKVLAFFPCLLLEQARVHRHRSLLQLRNNAINTNRNENCFQAILRYFRHHYAHIGRTGSYSSEFNSSCYREQAELKLRHVAVIAFADDVSLVGRAQDLKVAFQILQGDDGAQGIVCKCNIGNAS